MDVVSVPVLNPCRTFLFIRIQQNPSFYGRVLRHLGNRQLGWEEWLDQFVEVGVGERPLGNQEADRMQKAIEELLAIDLIQYVGSTEQAEDEDEPPEDEKVLPIEATE